MCGSLRQAEIAEGDAGSANDQLAFFSTITTFGTPRDVTIDELHIECCFPVDEATAALCRRLAEAG